MAAPSPVQERWLRSREVAQRLGVCRKTVQRYVAQGAFGQTLRLAEKDLRIAESALLRFIQERLA